MQFTTNLLILTCFSAQCSSVQVPSIGVSSLSGTEPKFIDPASISTTHSPSPDVHVIRRCEGEIVESTCVTPPPQVEKKPVEVLVVNIIPQVNQTQPPTTSDTPTPDPPPSSPTSAAPNPQSKVIVQQSVNLPNGQSDPINDPIPGPFGGGWAGGCGVGRCGFISPMASALRAGIIARFGARLGF
ncbi:hypothetical protein DSO57_1033998 [Entomophthora muscae]|uniref:Uncharacterized protein n=1 Tax=Entomophthora muscae TaxID=34485 RepID=A0ACC2U9H2_9FUNG|nr:hypothetical protein DSO57_1033998 [Entomophthora muscae]